jgi:hypothetical protein
VQTVVVVMLSFRTFLGVYAICAENSLSAAIRYSMLATTCELRIPND